MHIIANAYAATAPAAAHAAPAGAGVIDLVTLVLIVAVFYFLIIRPQSKRQREQKALIASLAVGDEVVTASGFLARVVELGPMFTTVEIASGVNAKIQTSMIQQLLPKDSIKKAQ